MLGGPRMAGLDFTLDHIGVVVPHVPVAGQAYQRLGFTITPKSSHKRQRADGGFDPLGTGNHCVMLRRGYLELIGITDASLPHDSLKKRLDRYHGLQLIALGTEDAAAVEKAWMATGEGVRPLAPLGRDVPQVGGGTKYGSFSIVYLENEAFPEAELFAIQHHSVPVLWQPPLLDHPNGAQGLVGLDLVTPDLARTKERLTRFGVVPESRDGIAVAGLSDGGEITLLTPDQARARYSGVALPPVPCVAAMRIAVDDLARTADYFSTTGVTFKAVQNALRIRPQDACGVVVDFVEGSE